MKIRVVAALGALAVVLPLVAISLAGQGKKDSAGPAHKIVHYGDLKWTPIIPGSEMAVVSGDPSKEGEPFVIRIRTTDGAKVPPHWHPTDEYVTVLKGTFLVGRGEAYDETKLETMNVGNFTMIPKEMRHFATCKGETIVQVHGMGPFKVNWVNPADVPTAAVTPEKK
jgi:quercetin dioxygenase-like cupin family protein